MVVVTVVVMKIEFINSNRTEILNRTYCYRCVLVKYSASLVLHVMGRVRGVWEMRGRDCRVSDTTDTQTQPDVEPGLENPSARCHSSFSSTRSPTPVSTHPRHFPTHTARAQRCTCRLSPPGCRPHPQQSSPFTLFPSYCRRAEQGTHSFPQPHTRPPHPIHHHQQHHDGR